MSAMKHTLADILSRWSWKMKKTRILEQVFTWATIACATFISVLYGDKALLLAIGTAGFGMFSGALAALNTWDK